MKLKNINEIYKYLIKINLRQFNNFKIQINLKFKKNLKYLYNNNYYNIIFNYL
jgi:hypothetical protein